jgi:hypothetical protein
MVKTKVTKSKFAKRSSREFRLAKSFKGFFARDVDYGIRSVRPITATLRRLISDPQRSLADPGPRCEMMMSRHLEHCLYSGAIQCRADSSQQLILFNI